MKSKECLFCNIPEERIIHETGYGYTIYDGFPVSEGHMLIIPKRHITNIMQVKSTELLGLYDLLYISQNYLTRLHTINGFNIGINQGSAAGQTIDHLHIHLIPRYQGDVEDPVGGVRNIIPGKGNYLKGEKK